MSPREAGDGLSNESSSPPPPVDSEKDTGRDTAERRPSHEADSLIGTGIPVPASPTGKRSPFGKRIKSAATALLEKAGLDWGILIQIIKMGLAPALVLSILTVPTVATQLTPNGFMAAIISVLGFPFLPYIKVFQMVGINILAAALAASFNLLAGFTIVKTRLHTQPEHTPDPAASPLLDAPYNSSAAAVTGIWLFVQMYALSVVRNRFPALNVPGIIYSMFLVTTLVVAQWWSSMSVGIIAICRLLLTFVLGSVCSLLIAVFVFPATSRGAVLKLIAKFIKLAGEILVELVVYLRSLEELGRAGQDDLLTGSDSDRQQDGKDGPATGGRKESKLAMPALTKALQGLYSRLSEEVSFARREIAWSVLSPVHFSAIYRLLRGALFALIELGSIVDVFERIRERRRPARPEEGDPTPGPGGDVFQEKATFFAVWELDNEVDRHEMSDHWSRLIGKLHEPIEVLVISCIQVFDHFLLVLHLATDHTDSTLPSLGPSMMKLKGWREGGFGHHPSSDEPDPERVADLPIMPGDSAFMDSFDNKISQFSASRDQILRDWTRENKSLAGLGPRLVLGDDADQDEWKDGLISLFLYTHTMIYSTAGLIGRLGHYADELKAAGGLETKRLYFPGWLRIKKGIWTAFFGHSVYSGAGLDEAGEGRPAGRALSRVDDAVIDLNLDLDKHNHHRRRQAGWRSRWLSQLRKRLGKPDVLPAKQNHALEKSARKAEVRMRPRNPDHLPPQSRAEKLGDHIRTIGEFFASPESRTGFRVACAVMSIAITAFLRKTTYWFHEQRGLWALIVMPLSMNLTSGKAFKSFGLRLISTLTAIVLAFLVWYIPAGRTAGVIVFVGIGQSLISAVMMLYPEFRPATVTASVTLFSIIGYQLQVGIVGEAVISLSQQPVYPIYIFAPYRGLVVIIATAIAFIWTVFPYPVSEKSVVRQQLSGGLYLLSTYYALVHHAVGSRLEGEVEERLYQPWPVPRSGNQKGPSGASVHTKLDQPRGPAVDMLAGYTIAGKLRVRLYSKLIALLGDANQAMEMVRWEFPIGGRFPHASYADLLKQISSITTYITLIEHASLSYHRYYGVRSAQKSRLNTGKLMVSAGSKINISLSSILKPTFPDGRLGSLLQPDGRSHDGGTETMVAQCEHDNIAQAYTALTRALEFTNRSIIAQTSLLAGLLNNGQALPPFFSAISTPPILLYDGTKFAHWLPEKSDEKKDGEGGDKVVVARVGESVWDGKRRLSIVAQAGIAPIPLSKQLSAQVALPSKNPSFVSLPDEARPARTPSSAVDDSHRATDKAESRPSRREQQLERTKQTADAAAAAAVITIASACVHQDYLNILRDIGDIVGRVDLGNLLLLSDVGVAGEDGLGPEPAAGRGAAPSSAYFRRRAVAGREGAVFPASSAVSFEAGLGRESAARR